LKSFGFAVNAIDSFINKVIRSYILLYNILIIIRGSAKMYEYMIKYRDAFGKEHRQWFSLERRAREEAWQIQFYYAIRVRLFRRTYG